MKVGINLATQPFRRDRPVIVGGVVLGTALTVLLAMLIYLSVNERGALAEGRHGVDQLQRRIKTVSVEQQKLDAILRRPENAEVLERSEFLNALLYRKGISWTRIFADLEKVVPHNVRIMQIRPTLNSKNQVVLDMQVGTENPEPLITFLKILEESPLFGPAYLHTSAPPSQSEPLWKYRISVNYAQRLDAPPGGTTKISQILESAPQPARKPAAPAVPPAQPVPVAQPGPSVQRAPAAQPVPAAQPRPAAAPPRPVVPPAAMAPTPNTAAPNPAAPNPAAPNTATPNPAAPNNNPFQPRFRHIPTKNHEQE